MSEARLSSQNAIATVRSLILDTFSRRGLLRFCQDHVIFQPVLEWLDPDASLEDMADVLIGYCQRQMLLYDLLLKMEEQKFGQDTSQAIPETVQGFALLAASIAEQEAREWDDQQHGLFTYYLMEGLSGKADLEGKGFITLMDLASYVQDTVRRRALERGGSHQRPTFRFHGVEDSILVSFQKGPFSKDTGQAEEQANPFGNVGCITDPARFFNREKVLRILHDDLANGQCVSLQGGPGLGKSSILYYLYATRADWARQGTAVLYVDLQAVSGEEDLYATILKQLGQKGASSQAVERALRQTRMILLLDEVQELVTSTLSSNLPMFLRSLHQSAGLVMVIASRERLYETSQSMSRVSSFLNIFHSVRLQPFSDEVARTLLSQRLQGTGIVFTETEIEQLIVQSKGNPAQLQEAAAELYGRRIKDRTFSPIPNLYRISSPMGPDQVVLREDLLRRLGELWRGDKRPSVLLYGHRRMGKTSLLRIVDKYTPSDSLLIYLDMGRVAGSVEGTHSLLLYMADAVATAAQKRGMDLPEPDPVEYTASATSVYSFRQTLQQLLSALPAGAVLILALDEYEGLEIAVQRGQLDRDIFNYLRSLAQELGIVLVFAGRHALQDVSTSFGAAFLGVLQLVRLSYLSREESARLIMQPGPDFSLAYDPQAVERIIDLTHGHPALIQLVCSELVNYCNEKRRSRVTEADVETVTDRPEFYQATYVFDGLWHELSEDQRSVITVLARSGKGMTAETVSRQAKLSPATTRDILEGMLQDEVVEKLEHHWYITVELVRRWINSQLKGQ